MCIPTFPLYRKTIVEAATPRRNVSGRAHTHSCKLRVSHRNPPLSQHSGPAHWSCFIFMRPFAAIQTLHVFTNKNSTQLHMFAQENNAHKCARNHTGNN